MLYNPTIDRQKDVMFGDQEVKRTSNEAIVALSCPSCGGPVAFGQSGCSYCGSGLLRKEGKGVQKFLIPNNAREYKKGIDFSEDDDLRTIIRKMEGSKQNGAYSYVVWREIPVLVGDGIDEETALENFRSARTNLSREKLGDKWTHALAEFRGFLESVEQMPVTERIDVGDRYFDSWGKNRLLPHGAKDFFIKPSFSNFETIMSIMPGNDDADTLVGGVSTISSFMQQDK